MSARTPSAFRLAASAAAIAVAAFASAPAFAGNPLTETPNGRGGREAPLATEKPDAKPAMQPQGMDEERTTANPTANDIIRSLAPFADGNPGAGYRDVDAGGRKVRVDYGRAVDLTVFFLYDSFQLTPEARVQLEPLGRALQSEKLAGRRFLIAGHTDAAGGAEYNRILSGRRAAAVKRFLVQAYDIDPERLVIYGWGESRLKNPDNPLSRVNRRVEVALINEPRRSSSLGSERHEASYDGCGPDEMTDPRLRRQLDLDDYGTAPAAVCEDTIDIRDLVYVPRRR